ncbi:MAG: EF2563 family selenium-dependent molybdenum hydroxylase system protein [bacterium]|nr:EF2563 family selenium-dependent molybdenum hydroxylase system protein [bacterium]MCP4799775.1 EF2563 family selenium-dependent molybdenum hydroxylase system protein [bacterium]
MSLIWIAGAGELASAVGWRLSKSGYAVVMTEIATPLAVRRPICFSEAVHQGKCIVESVVGELASSDICDIDPGDIKVMVDPEGSSARGLNPDALVDARMLKKNIESVAWPELFTIGLGPGFTCTQNADVVIETHRMARLGEVIHNGSASPNTGEPGPVNGITHGRLLRSPADGVLKTKCKIGDLVSAQQVIGTVSGEPLIAEIDGLLRGLVHSSAELKTGVKVGDIDPRGCRVDPGKITDKGLAVAGGVLEALLNKGILPIR